jgi:multidrug resistance efflux pump
MDEIQVPSHEETDVLSRPARITDPLRRWTLVVLGLCILVFGWTLIAHRLTPYTSDASVRSFVARMVPEVSGKVVEVAVRDNQSVHTGDLLYQIGQMPFRIAVEQAEARLAAAGQAVGASTAAVDAADSINSTSISLRNRRRNVAIVSWSGWSFAAIKRNATES